MEVEIDETRSNFWNRYVSIMKILDPNNDSLELLLGNVVVVILRLNSDIKIMVFNNLKNIFSLESSEYLLLREVDHLF